jgi:phosphoribosylanthranilate isomerase
MIPVKICGITRGEDAVLAAELGATWVGFVFWPKSPRFVTRAAAADILATLPAHVTGVGVFVDQPAADVDATAAQVGLGSVQLHGDENPAAYRVGGRRVIKALRLASESNASAADPVPRDVTLLVDAFDPVRMGGTGRQVDWTVAAAIARRRPTILSGGLRAENVQEALARVGPYALDVSSGIESTPGIKDPARMRAFFDAVRGAASSESASPIESTRGAQS